MMDKLTNREYWDESYIERKSVTPVEPNGWKNHCVRKIYEIKRRIGIDKKNVLEVGGGGSGWLVYLAKEYPGSNFTCLDYSDVGLDIIHRYVSEHDIYNVDLLKCDLFDAPEQEAGRYSFVYSHGVVEHFDELAKALSAQAQFLSKDGCLLTVIPNMSGLLGLLVKFFDKEIYDIHNPHDLKSFLIGHDKAGLDIIEAGYLCSNNFGVLSSCINDKGKFKQVLYMLLVKISKLSWWFEERFFDFPSTKVMSPYIYAVSKNK